MLTDQTRAPIVEALAEFKAQGAISFGVPGHKSGKAAPEEVDDYRRFVLALANKVAAAHREGGQDVSPAEAEAVQQISAALGTPAS